MGGWIVLNRSIWGGKRRSSGLCVYLSVVYLFLLLFSTPPLKRTTYMLCRCASVSCSTCTIVVPVLIYRSLGRYIHMYVYMFRMCTSVQYLYITTNLCCVYNGVLL